MQYELDVDPYIDKSTGIFRNLQGITTQSNLEKAEALLTSEQSVFLSQNPLEAPFNLDYLCRIHQQLFSDLYDWAGKLRTVEIQKGDTEFCKSGVITTFAESIFDEIGTDIDLRSEDKHVFVARLAHYYSEINLLHPFREGNGRVLRIFIQALAKHYGWSVDWTELDAKTNIAASVAAYHGDESPLVDMLEPLVSRENQEII